MKKIKIDEGSEIHKHQKDLRKNTNNELYQHSNENRAKKNTKRK